MHITRDNVGLLNSIGWWFAGASFLAPSFGLFVGFLSATVVMWALHMLATVMLDDGTDGGIETIREEWTPDERDDES